MLDGYLDMMPVPEASPAEKKHRAMSPVDYMPDSVKFQLRQAALSSLKLPEADCDEVAGAVALLTSPADRRKYPDPHVKTIHIC